jgi:glyoxylase-like metal-dependent hydrolase (beta-lactamase superfamily II)
MTAPDTKSEASAAARTAGVVDQPEYAPVPAAALPPRLNERGYHVGRVERNLYWVTDGVYQSAFLTSAEGVVLLDAPPALGHNIQRAVDEVAAANGVGNTVTHLVYSHHHADHAAASALFGEDVRRFGHEETRNLLLRHANPARPAPEETFAERRSLEIGGERIELAWHGSNHSPDNVFIYLPDHDALMLVDVVSPGWAPDYRGTLSADVQGCIAAAAIALEYSWSHFLGGRLGRLGTREDVARHQRYVGDLRDAALAALDATDPAVFLNLYGANAAAATKEYLDAVAAAAAAPVVEKYTGVLAGADVFTAGTAFQMVQSLRLDLGHGLEVHA